MPFSLNGQPPAPKPANDAVDSKFEPSEAQTEAFTQALTDALSGPQEDVAKQICDALEIPVTQILHRCDADASREGVAAWLTQERDAPGSQETRAPVVALEANTKMARGEAPPDVGYAVGQLWRKWQNPLRAAFNGTRVGETGTLDLIAFDEGLKRYSYGPPVAAAEELLILISQGLVDLRIVDDPDIALTVTGWSLTEGDDAAHAAVMIDAVLPSPDLEHVQAPLLNALADQGFLTPFADGFGADTLPDGQLHAQDAFDGVQISLLGRLSLGSVIAADSVHDCFGETSLRWASAVVTRATPTSG